MCKTIELRDYFAIHATDSDIREVRLERFEAAVRAKEDMDKFEPLSCVEARYAFADAMMRARQPEIRVEVKVTDRRGPAYDGIGISAVEYAQGWRSWDGEGVPPAKPEELVAVKLRDQKAHPEPRKCENWNWDRTGLLSDIVAYRVVKP